ERADRQADPVRDRAGRRRPRQPRPGGGPRHGARVLPERRARRRRPRPPLPPCPPSRPPGRGRRRPDAGRRGTGGAMTPRRSGIGPLAVLTVAAMLPALVLFGVFRWADGKATAAADAVPP